MSTDPARLGVVLAGGRATRLGGDKAGAKLAGRPLLAHATATVRAAGLLPRVCAREGTWLPSVDVEEWREPLHVTTPVGSEAGATDPSAAAHPLAGLAYALRRAAEPIVALPVDLPFLPAEVLRALAGRTETLVLLASGGRPASLVLRADPVHAESIATAARSGAPALRTLVDLGAVLLDLQQIVPEAPAHALFNVSTAADLTEAHRLLRT
ncbi:MAG: NTP transferase domain-containing protein [Solirubrobacteraceae bacterium]|nr:NTP transferase domain-containing protein [Solirubrobacteraceae bacterium]